MLVRGYTGRAIGCSISSSEELILKSTLLLEFKLTTKSGDHRLAAAWL